MRQKYIHIFILSIVLLVWTGCSTSKNTNMSRRYHAMLAKYNIGYNGDVSYKEGMENILKANKDDYSQVIQLYPISNHANTSSAAGNMDRVIEKSRKAIKLHSIKKKPERDYKRYNDPVYKAFYNQNEFNPELKKAWIQLGKAEFHKGDFLGAVGTFSYITRHYASTPDVVMTAQLWTARAYRELDWLYEAENILTKIKPNSVSVENAGLYASTWADLLIKQQEYKRAIPYLKTAIEQEKDKKIRTRFNFVMAQLLERTGDKQGASEYYSRVIKAIPSYEMSFNARINRAQLIDVNPASIEKELLRMARNENNKDYLDQIYTAIGKVYLAQKDTTKAIKNFDLAIEKSTRNSVEKGVALVTMGDLYYDNREYVKAHPYYDEAAKIYTKEYIDFERINHRSLVLGELVKEHEVVHLQDSLQALARMSEDDRLAAINRTIEKLKEEEKKEEDDKLMAEAKSRDEDFRMPMTQIGGGSSDWYFYNAVTVNNGKNDFRRRWGNRKLEDNWRRSNKSEALFAEGDENNEVTDSIFSDNDTIPKVPGVPDFKQTSDKKSVDYYLAQIPFTAAQKERSDLQIADGLYNMGFVYKDKIEDYPLAHKTFEDFQRRFGTDERVLDVLFQRFLLASKLNDNASANQFRNEILTNYADSKIAQMLEDPDYIRNQQRMFVEQDEIYNQTYAAFTQSNYQTVFKNTEHVKKKFPLSKLLPQFEFLNTLSIGKTAGSEKFEESLNALVANYPESNISALSKDILALLKQGNIAKEGGTFGSLLTKRDLESLTPEEQEAAAFSELKFAPHRLMLISDANNDAINKLQYNLAIFNFSRFMVKDFGFGLTQVDNTNRALSVLNLASYNEAVWYQNTLKTDAELMQQMDSMGIRQVIISEDNFGKLQTVFTLDDYLAFEQEYLVKDVPTALLAASDASLPVEKSTTVEIIDGTKLVEPKQKPVSQPKEPDTTPQSSTESQKETKPDKAELPTKKEEPKPDKSAQTQKKEEVKPVQPKEPEVAAAKETSNLIVQQESDLKSKEEEKPKDLFKGLYAYQAEAPHYVAFYIPRGGRFDFNVVKKALDEYNSANYGALNLKVTLEDFGKESIIFVSTFADANIAKSYFLRLLKDPAIVKATSGMNKRNLVTTRENLNVMLHNDALDIYFEFMREFYLK